MKKVILFDFDGVIVDSFETAYSVSSKFIINPSREHYRDRFMGNVYDSVKKENPNTDLEARLKKYFNIYGPRLLTLPVIPGMTKVIKELAKKYTTAHPD